MENPLVWWREWWRGLGVIERAVVIVTLAGAIFVLIVSQASAADTDISAMNSIWTVLIVSVVTGTFSPALLLWLKSRSDRQQRFDDAEFRKQERLATEAREDAREIRAIEAQRLTIAGLEIIKKQTDGVITQVTALAKATGHIEGTKEATQKADDTAATLALGQQQGRDAERESIAAKTITTNEESAKPLPVVDKITNETGERAAQALESMANSAKNTAKPIEEKK